MKRKREILKMDDFSNVLVNASEFVPGRLYFVTLNTDISPKSTTCAHYFTVDTELCYDSFYNDFGPLNLSMLYHYCTKLHKKMNNLSLKNKKIIHYTGLNDKNRVNAAFLIGAYSVINLNYEPTRAFEVLTRGSTKEYVPFRDASIGIPYTLCLLDCLKAIRKALDCGFFNFDSFDFFEYEYYERVENGDLNWIVPDKFLAFCGPQNKSIIDKGYPIHSPETYFAYFRRHNVTTIIRLNKKAYDSNRFVHAGFDHKDLFFIDGGLPNDRILNRFITICENSKGAVAVHCKAGLGRTGTLIACYMMKHYKFTAEEAIAWIRICRPGSIIAHQQTWLLQKQKALWAAGDAHRQKLKLTAPIKHTVGIYGASKSNNNQTKSNDNMTGIMKKVDLMEINDNNDDFKSEENNHTQGDKLNEIKIQRSLGVKPLGSNISQHRTTRTKVTVTTTTTPPAGRVGRIITHTAKSTSSSTRVLTKRNELNDSPRRSQRKLLTQQSKDKINNKIVERKMLTTTSKKDETVTTNNNNSTTFRWLPKKNNINKQHFISTTATSTTATVADRFLKRGKRSLILEKDKTNPRLVKVLRRSHGQSSQEINGKVVNGGKLLRLPSVKLNNSI